MNQIIKPVWKTLCNAGVVSGDVPDIDHIDSPWYVKVLMAFSGWLASLFLFGFLAVGFETILDSSLSAFITGGIVIGSAYFVLRIPKNEFVEHIGLALSLAGQALIAWAIFKAFRQDYAVVWGLVATAQMLLAIIMPNFIHRVFSACLSAFAFSISLSNIGAPYIFSSIVMFVVAWLWLNEFRFVKHMRKIRAIAYGLVLALVQLKGSVLFGGTWKLSNSQSSQWIAPWMAEVLASTVLLYVVWQLLDRHRQHLSNRMFTMVLVGTVLLCAASMEATGITVGVTIIILGFSSSNRILIGLGVVSLLFYISAYYYLLDITLLDKSFVLFGVGAILLLARWVMLRVVSVDKEESHAR